jgi:hypothetical protein
MFSNGLYTLEEGIGKFSAGEEAEFKRAFVNLLRNDGETAFDIETEETAPGFPDVLCLGVENRAILYEMKVTDNYGFVKFTKAQPLFYKNNKELNMRCVVWDVPNHRCLIVNPQRVIALKKLRMHVSELAE